MYCQLAIYQIKQSYLIKIPYATPDTKPDIGHWIDPMTEHDESIKYTHTLDIAYLYQ